MPVYKDKARNTWFVQKSLTLWNGTSKVIKKRGFHSREEARRYEEELTTQFFNFEKIPFNKYVDMYIADMKGILAPSSMESMIPRIKKHILPVWKDIPIASITSEDIQTYLNKLPAAGNLSQSTIVLLYAILRAMFKHACNTYNLATNPMNACYCPVSSVRKNHHIWTPTELQKALLILKDKPDEALAIKMLYFTGLRIGELLALTPSDINHEEQSIQISKSYSRITKKAGDPKTPQSKRILLLPPLLYAELIRYISEATISYSERIFQHVNMPRIRHCLSLASTYWNQPGIRIHELRHSNASLLNALGFSPFAIKNRLGHSTIITTINTYTRIFRKQEEEVTNKMDYVEQGKKSSPPYPIIIQPISDGYSVTIPDFPEIPPSVYSSILNAKKQTYKKIKEIVKEKGDTTPTPLISIPMDENSIIILYNE